MRLKSSLLLALLVLCAGFMSVVCAEDQGDRHIFSTWDSFEVDKCASIWLIKRFVDKDAQFKFFKRENVISLGTPFDTPEAALRRYHNLSTFQSILNHYQLKDPVLIEIGKRTFDIEINYWGEKRYEDSKTIEQNVKKIILGYKDTQRVITESLLYFDSVYEHYNKITHK